MSSSHLACVTNVWISNYNYCLHYWILYHKKDLLNSIRAKNSSDLIWDWCVVNLIQIDQISMVSYKSDDERCIIWTNLVNLTIMTGFDVYFLANTREDPCTTNFTNSDFWNAFIWFSKRYFGLLLWVIPYMYVFWYRDTTSLFKKSRSDTIVSGLLIIRIPLIQRL